MAAYARHFGNSLTPYSPVVCGGRAARAHNNKAKGFAAIDMTEPNLMLADAALRSYVLSVGTFDDTAARVDFGRSFVKGLHKQMQDAQGLDGTGLSLQSKTYSEVWAQGHSRPKQSV